MHKMYKLAFVGFLLGSVVASYGMQGLLKEDKPNPGIITRAQVTPTKEPSPITRVRVLPVTLDDGEWYALLGHDSRSQNYKMHWNDFQGHSSYFDVVSSAIRTLSDNTNGQIRIFEDYLSKYSYSIEFEPHQMRMYFIYFNLPKDSLGLNAGDLTKKAQELKLQGEQLKKDVFAWVPIQTVLDDGVFTSMIVGPGPEEIAQVVRGIADRKLSTILKDNWQAVRQQLHLNVGGKAVPLLYLKVGGKEVPQCRVSIPEEPIKRPSTIGNLQKKLVALKEKLENLATILRK